MHEEAAARVRAGESRRRKERAALKAKIGQHVIVFESDGVTVWAIGKYAGNERYPGAGNTDYTKPPPDVTGNTGATINVFINPKGQYVPKIELKDGTVIWGPECWWAFIDLDLPDGPLETIEDLI